MTVTSYGNTLLCNYTKSTLIFICTFIMCQLARINECLCMCMWCVCACMQDEHQNDFKMNLEVYSNLSFFVVI